MQISFENPDKVNGLLTITVEENDFKDDVEKTLKDYRKRANVPGFRPGQVPMGMIKRQFGTQVKVDVINKLLGENLDKYITDNKINMLGQPLPHEGQAPVDLEKAAPYTFQFDIAVAPEFRLSSQAATRWHTMISRSTTTLSTSRLTCSQAVPAAMPRPMFTILSSATC